MNAISTARITLEPVAAHHAALMFDGLQDHRAYAYLPDAPPSSIGALESRYARLATGVSHDGREFWLNWMLRLSGTSSYIGYVQATIIRDEAASLVAYHVFPPFWRSGYGGEAVLGMLNMIRTCYDLDEARAYVDTRNSASLKLLERLGFRLSSMIANAETIHGMPSDEYLYIQRFNA